MQPSHLFKHGLVVEGSETPEELEEAHLWCHIAEAVAALRHHHGVIVDIEVLRS